MKSRVPSFVAGQEYKRSTLHDQFGGSRQSGISVSAQVPVALLFTGNSGHQYGYQDGFEADGTFSYTGEGQVADMKMERGNKAVRDSVSSGRQLHLFEETRKGYARYVGIASYLDHRERLAPDRHGDLRKVIIFQFDLDAPAQGSEAQNAPADREEKSQMWKRSLPELRKLAIDRPPSEIPPQERKVLVRERSQAVKIYVRKRAAGKCECCEAPAPFETPAGHPYLEPHHISRLADGGPDHPAFVAAVCPTCHKHIHYGKGGSELNQRLGKKIRALEE